MVEGMAAVINGTGKARVPVGLEAWIVKISREGA
jgi:hypothetical protein